ncbi:MAG: DNA repair protein RecN [Betaproteobacteria bacterium]|jgi:DNA repair protein RecN (Recombination protein N)|nr:DNA repair protein RecN [Betaproteobacteria bacterium]MDH5207731.1 DNA repair protein RecN [Burkholderiaceae bacterium]
MLLSLAIRNFVIVESLELDFAPGFTVLTGETGAGKSILIDALLLALGERAGADVVREGAARAEISAEFRAGPDILAWAQAQDLAGADDAGMLVRRSIDAGGRSKAFINGSPVTLAQLRELGERLLDVHGQHAHQSLLKPSEQLALLDEHGGLGAERRDLAQAWAAWKREQRAREDAEAMAASALAEQDRLRFIVEELDAIAPQAGEWAAIQAEHKRLSHAAGLLDGARAAVDALSEADGSALAQVGNVSARLAQLVPYDERLQPALELLTAAQIQLDEAVTTLRRYLDKTDLDASRLAEVDARLSALHGAARKFRTSPEEIADLLATSRDRLAALASAGDLEAIRARESALRGVYERQAGALSKRRATAATRMAQEVTRAMQDLNMEGGRFEVALAPGDPTAAGLERVEFLVAGHAGVQPKPLAKVASGGELARISLAISVIAANATPVATLIFDEVDAGIGGAVADTVGRLLKRLGQSRQVLAVTHLPQVAAHGDQHFVVLKETDETGRPVSRLQQLDRKTRVEELARMLGGQEITETTRKHARELLAS